MWEMSKSITKIQLKPTLLLRLLTWLTLVNITNHRNGDMKLTIINWKFLDKKFHRPKLCRKWFVKSTIWSNNLLKKAKMLPLEFTVRTELIELGFLWLLIWLNFRKWVSTQLFLLSIKLESLVFLKKRSLFKNYNETMENPINQLKMTQFLKFLKNWKISDFDLYN